MSDRTLLERLDGAQVVVCAGPGGVGKTTTAAALGLALARDGRRVAVVTIDPARRLADALGLGTLGNDPERVPAAALDALGVVPPGELWAMMLDPKRTFDALVRELSPDEATSDRVLANPLYRQISTAAGGSHEFTAVARLHDLHRDPRFDVVVLDTPPSRNALDFLDAPDRIAGFLEGRAVRALLGQGRGGIAARVARRGTGLALGALQRLTGVDLLRDLATFFEALGPLTEGFAARATAVRTLLRDPATRFVVVTSPAPVAAGEAVFFRRHLRDVEMPFTGLVINRVSVVAEPDQDRDGATVAGELTAALGEQLAARVGRTWDEHRRLAECDREIVAELARTVGDRHPTVVPTFDHEVFDLPALAAVRDALAAR
ncbi:ArsA family ATPase [Patulibacter medicamentivorans]|uniref:ArsA family ATPase n=1 Tax=Patulibacter medicamentivorans TaxID=1097667 RepID=UPI0002F58D79|nr:ArsA-related P-loop ATPase [Patulibacter medicamentivorans]